MNKITVFLLIVIMTLSFIVGATMQGKAQNKSFAGVIPFVSSTDRVGFFDQSSGKIYMYDSDLSECLFVGQLAGLGQPIQKMQSKSQIRQNYSIPLQNDH